MTRSISRNMSRLTNKERQAHEEELDRLLRDIEDRTYPQVTDAIDFVRLDTIEEHLVAELKRLIVEGKLPTPPSTEVVAAQARAMISALLYRVPQDPRRTKRTDDDDDDCELCRAFGGPAWVS